MEIKIKLGEDYSDSDVIKALGGPGVILVLPDETEKRFSIWKDSTGIYVNGPSSSELGDARKEIVKELGYDKRGISPYLDKNEDSIIVFRHLERMYLNQYGISKKSKLVEDLDSDGNPNYYQDLSLHIGRKIKLLVDAPRGGSLKAGDIGEIVDALTIKFKTNPSYTYMSALDRDNLNIKCELLPKDFQTATVGEKMGNNFENCFEPSPTNFGLEIGDHLDPDVISRWAQSGKNYASNSEMGSFIQSSGGRFVGARKIQEFRMFKDGLGFLVSDTLSVYLRAEGFKEFADIY